MLLRCLDIGVYALPDGQILDKAGLVGLYEKLVVGAHDENAHRASAEDFTLTIPGHKCLLTSVPVAKHEAALLRKTLPWVLEERLLEPAETQHFALGKITGNTAAVCVVNSSWLATILAELAAAGIHPSEVIPEILLLPWQQQGRWSLLLESHPGSEPRCLIRFDEYAGLTCSLANLHFVLQALLNETTETPENIAVFARAEMAEEIQHQLPPLLQSRFILQQPFTWRPLAAANYGFNLLQGDFAPRVPWRNLWQQWRLVALLLVGLFVTDLVATTLQTAKVQRATAAIDADIVELFRSVQPEATIVDPRLQLERAVAALGGSNNGGLTELLERMAPALASSPAVQVQNLDYNSSTGELQMVIVSEGFAAAETLRAELQNIGLDAELLGSSSEGTRNRSRLRVVI